MNTNVVMALKSAEKSHAATVVISGVSIAVTGYRSISGAMAGSRAIDRRAGGKCETVGAGCIDAIDARMIDIVARRAPGRTEIIAARPGCISSDIVCAVVGRIGAEHMRALLTGEPAVTGRDDDMRAIIGDGNSKIGPVPCYSTMPGDAGKCVTWSDGSVIAPRELATCKHGCPFADSGSRGGCYALSQVRQYEDVARIAAHNARLELDAMAGTDDARDDYNLDVWADDVISQLVLKAKLSGSYKARLYESGDARSYYHLEALYGAADRYKSSGVSIAMYTRRYSWVAEHAHAYNDSIIVPVFSANSIKHASYLLDKYEDVGINVFAAVDDVHDAIDENTPVCAAAGRSGITCSSCGMCYRKGTGIIAGPVHGSARKINN